MPSSALVAVRVRPSETVTCPWATLRSMSWIAVMPSSTLLPATAQPRVFAWQSATKWRRLSSKPSAWASVAARSPSVGSTAPSSTMRPVRRGKRCA